MIGMRFDFGTGKQERRLLRYSSNLDRFVGTASDYDYLNPFEAAAGTTHIVTQGLGLDPAIRDAARAIDGDERPIDQYGQFGRIREDVFGAVDNLFHLKPVSAVAKVINLVGDSIADGADFIVDVDHKRGAVHSEVASVMNN